MLFLVDHLVPEANPIELLGYAKNEIVEVSSIVHTLPQELKDKLQVAYWYLHEVQEYIYNDPLVA